MSTILTYPGGSAIIADFAARGTADAEVVSRTITHEILDGPPVHTLRPAKPQTGTLTLLFSTEQTAHRAKDQLTAAAVFTITSTDSANLPARIIVRTVRVEQHDRAEGVWTVLIDYEAVT